MTIQRGVVDLLKKLTYIGYWQDIEAGRAIGYRGPVSIEGGIPYLGNAPDFLIGYNAGYRTSWDCASGMVSGPVYEDNVKAWSGDNCIDPRIVPGVFFCNHEIDDDDPALIDIAPTALKLFGVEPPEHMDGKPLFTRASLNGGGAGAPAGAAAADDERTEPLDHRVDGDDLGPHDVEELGEHAGGRAGDDPPPRRCVDLQRPRRRATR